MFQDKHPQAEGVLNGLLAGCRPEDFQRAMTRKNKALEMYGPKGGVKLTVPLLGAVLVAQVRGSAAPNYRVTHRLGGGLKCECVDYSRGLKNSRSAAPTCTAGQIWCKHIMATELEWFRIYGKTPAWRIEPKPSSFDEIPENENEGNKNTPSSPPPAAPPAFLYIRLEGGAHDHELFRLTGGRTWAMTREIKCLPKRWYDPHTKTWFIPETEHMRAFRYFRDAGLDLLDEENVAVNWIWG